jgi:hypothetical protein
MQQGLSLNYYLLFCNSKFEQFYLDKDLLDEKIKKLNKMKIINFYYTNCLDHNTKIIDFLIINKHNINSNLEKLKSFEYMIAIIKEKNEYYFFGIFKNFHLLYVSIFKTDDDYIIIGDLGLYSEA